MCKWFNTGPKDRSKRRSETFEGIAEAMAEQWSSYLIETKGVNNVKLNKGSSAL